LTSLVVHLNRYGAALRHPGYRLLFFSLLPGTLGMMMAAVAFGYVAYSLSGSATTLALVNLGWGIPMFLLSAFAGEVADRYPRRNVLLATQGVVGLSALLAAVLIATGVIQVWQLMVVTLIQGTAFAFNIPARQALIAELVPPEDLANAVAMYNAGINFNRVAGPAAAGALLTIPALGATGVFSIMAALYCVVLAMLVRLPATSLARRIQPAGETRLTRLTAGVRYVAASPPLRQLMLLAFLPLLLGMPYQALMPAVAAEVFHVEAAGLGVLLTASGLGALAGSIVVAGIHGGPVTMARVQLITGLIFGIGLVVFGLNSSFGVALPILAIVGGASAAYTSINNTLLMSYTPPEYHGRVMGVYMMTFAAMPLSSLPAARVADALGLPITLILSGTLAALAVLIGGTSIWKKRPRYAASFPSFTRPSSRTVASTSAASGASSIT
jgi:MFS family permease